MIVALSLALTIPGTLSPILQAGTNRLFHEMVGNVVHATQAQDWKGAESALKALPKREIVIEWDDSAVPAALKPEFLQARQEFADEFAKQAVDWTVKYAKPGSIRVSFTKELPKLPSGIRAAAATLFSPNPKDPQVESVLSLIRGEPAVPTSGMDVYNELGFAVLQYMGKEPTPYPNEFAFRSEQPSNVKRRLGGMERVFMRRSALAIESLRLAVKNRTPLELSAPIAILDTKPITWPATVQGEVREFRLQISNPGNAPLLIQARPDCSCVFVEPALTIDPGQTALLKGGIDTTEFVGDLDKKIFLSTNDTAKPFLSIPVRVFAKPLFRMLQPSGSTVLVGPNGGTTTVYLAIDPQAKLNATGVQTSGLPSTATLSPWSGTLPDPEFKEPAKSRKGYRIPVKIAKGQPAGRFGVSVLVTTDHPKYPVIRHSFYVQNGIVALPPTVYFGEIRQSPRRGTSLISRPGRPFKIVRVLTGSPFVKAEALPSKTGDEYQIVVQLDGRQPLGPLNEVVQIITNDPSQPRIDLPVAANVK